MAELREPLGYFIGHVNDPKHRHKASSGGVGTMLQKHLLSTGQYGTSITFQFNAGMCMYEAKLIHAPEEVNICGSIYQDINIAHFIRDHIKDISNGIVVSCPPCQVTAIRNMLKKEGIPCFIISFCCSGQTTVEGTWKYYELLGIRKEDVINMQYRGNGWPSGIQIRLKDGTEICHDNYTEPWKTIHSSWLFRPERCFSCAFDTSWTADISLADPWIEKYRQHDKEGSTLFIVNSESGLTTIKQMQTSDKLTCEAVGSEMYRIAQMNNILKAEHVSRKRKQIQNTLKLVRNPFLHRLFSGNITLMRLFFKLRHHL